MGFTNGQLIVIGCTPDSSGHPVTLQRLDIATLEWPQLPLPRVVLLTHVCCVVNGLLQSLGNAATNDMHHQRELDFQTFTPTNTKATPPADAMEKRHYAHGKTRENARKVDMSRIRNP